VLNPITSAKAYVAAAASFLTALLVEWTDENPFQPRDLLVGLVAALVTFGATYGTPNGDPTGDRLNERGGTYTAVLILLGVAAILAIIFFAQRL
jgi:MFS family permease